MAKRVSMKELDRQIQSLKADMIGVKNAICAMRTGEKRSMGGMDVEQPAPCPEWVTMDGRKMRVHDMSLLHLARAISWCSKKERDFFKDGHFMASWIEIFAREIETRSATGVTCPEIVRRMRFAVTIGRKVHRVCGLHAWNILMKLTRTPSQNKTLAETFSTMKVGGEWRSRIGDFRRVA